MMLKDNIREIARQHGFDLCRFTRALISMKHIDAYKKWLKSGMSGEMTYMAEETRLQRRKRPEMMLQNVQSVITVGMCYTPPSNTITEAEEAQGRGVIAAYAQGEDYHDTMKKRLKALAADLDGLLGKYEQRVYVDTAPVLEHAFAEQSGLGWQGKHSLSINREHGSWLMLGELFTTAAIEADEPATNHCGSCHSCIDICPTKAIVAPYVVDARRCISYLTIELKGFIPSALRPILGNRIFGCDDCQITCPWNNHARLAEPDLLKPRKENDLPYLLDLFQLDEEGFRKRFRKSALKRTGRRGLLRNVAVAMGNSGDRRYIPALMAALNDSEILIRGHAAWALGELRATQALPELRSTFKTEEDQNVREEISNVINKIEQEMNLS